MFGYITQQATSVSLDRRPRQVIDAPAGPRQSQGARRVLGAALVTIGQRVAGEMPAAQPLRADADCA